MRWRALLLPLLLLASAPLLLHRLPEVMQQVRHPGVFAVLYALAMVTGVPCFPLALGAGALLGAGPGVVAVLGGEMLGSALCYAGGRWLGGDAVRDWAAEHPRLRWLPALLEREGTMVVGMSHFVPVLPFNVINYACGLLKVPFAGFLFWTFAGVVPGTLLAVLGSDQVAQFSRGEPVSPVLLGALAAVAVLFGLLLLLARRRLRARGGGSGGAEKLPM